MFCFLSDDVPRVQILLSDYIFIAFYPILYINTRMEKITQVNMPICWTFAAYLLSLTSSSTSSSTSSANHCQQQRPRPREVDWMTHYLLELSLLSKPAIVFSPSLVASAAVYMARFLFLDPETADPWPSTLSVPSTHRSTTRTSFQADTKIDD